MRVIAGKARRLPLVSPEGRGTRPTTDRIKETLFNILQDDIPGCRFWIYLVEAERLELRQSAEVPKKQSLLNLAKKHFPVFGRI